jgi:hypothetical protein
MIIGARGRFLYINDGGGSNIATAKGTYGFVINQLDGTLSGLPAFPFHPSVIAFLNSDPTGYFVYGGGSECQSNRDIHHRPIDGCIGANTSAFFYSRRSTLVGRGRRSAGITRSRRHSLKSRAKSRPNVLGEDLSSLLISTQWSVTSLLTT